MKILIVEDDLSTRKLEQLILERAGYKVIEAEDGEIALQLLDVEYIDLIILDILMPETNGIETLKRIKGNPITSCIPVILCTSVSEQNYVQKALSLGISGYILKPIKTKDLLQKIQNVEKNIEPVLKDPIRTAMKLGLDHHTYMQLLTLLIDNGKERLKKIGAKVESGDFGEFQLFVRDLSSSAQNLGASSLHRAAVEASTTVPKADKTLREQYFFKLKTEMERLNQVAQTIQ